MSFEFLLPSNVAEKLISALKEAGHQEIGGILMGEHISLNCFRVMDITIQKHGGALASFIRAIADILGPLKQFFVKTNHNYTQFNYLGEWHSHPLFSPTPSATDVQSMRDIISDDKVGANFVILFITRLNDNHDLEKTITVFLPDLNSFEGKLIFEN
jgi:integrative and conjugative element protein (TIGR02256 family)